MEEKETFENQNANENQNTVQTQNTVGSNSKEYWGMSESNFMTFMHLSQFAGFILPVAGYAAPIAMWITNKDQNEKIDQQGKYIVNFIISMVIYLTVSSILMIILIGFLLLPILGVIGIVLPIIGALKSSKGEVWKYPLSIQFIK
jgi:uncharacterized Tic20 family protein